MTDQDYREMTAAIKESGIALPMQKEIQRLIDKEFSNSKQQNKEELSE